jgi:hypothetical protein
LNWLPSVNFSGFPGAVFGRRRVFLASAGTVAIIDAVGCPVREKSPICGNSVKSPWQLAELAITV